MTDTAIPGALDRMETALNRLESTVEAVLAAPRAAAAAARDDHLREEVRAVIGELDRMIGGQRG